MRISPRVISSAAVIAITCAVTAAAYFYKNRNAEINEVMVFCKLQFNAYGCFDKLMSYVESARKSISVCMPGIQNPAIQGRLVKVMKQRNLKVRIIIDHSGYDPNIFLLKELIELGAEIKCYYNEQHHLQLKSCLVDDKVLLTGTLNWGNDQSADHWNYVYITNKDQLVKPVKDQFQYMWNYCSEYSTIRQNSQTGENGVNLTDQESHTEDCEGHLEHTESHPEHGGSHPGLCGSHQDHREPYLEHSEGNLEHSEGHLEHSDSQMGESDSHNAMHIISSETQILNSVTDISDCVQENQTFRRNVSTPEVYIN